MSLINDALKQASRAQKQRPSEPPPLGQALRPVDTLNQRRPVDALGPWLIIVVLVCFHPLLANLNQGLKAADRVLVDRLRTLNGSRWEIFRYVLWPSALPYYLAAHEIAFTTSIVGAIVAEWFLSRQGLGYVLVKAMTEYRGDRIYAATLISSAMSFAAYWLCRWLGRRLTRWQRV